MRLAIFLLDKRFPSVILISAPLQPYPWSSHSASYSTVITSTLPSSAACTDSRQSAPASCRSTVSSPPTSRFPKMKANRRHERNPCQPRPLMHSITSGSSGRRRHLGEHNTASLAELSLPSQTLLDVGEASPALNG